MPELAFKGRHINEIIAQVQAYLDQNGLKDITANVYLLPDELAERWRMEATSLSNWRVSGHGPRFLKLGDGPRAKIRYPLFGDGGILCQERGNTKDSTTG